VLYSRLLVLLFPRLVLNDNSSSSEHHLVLLLLLLLPSLTVSTCLLLLVAGSQILISIQLPCHDPHTHKHKRILSGC
jgi:hypothetical protein